MTERRDHGRLLSLGTFLSSPGDHSLALCSSLWQCFVGAEANLGWWEVGWRVGRVELGPRNCWTEQNEKLFPIWKVSWRLLLWYAVKHVFHLGHNKSYKHFTLCIRGCIFNGTSFHIEHVPTSLFDDTFWTFYHCGRWNISQPWQIPDELAKHLCGNDSEGFIGISFFICFCTRCVGDWNVHIAFIVAFASLIWRKPRGNPGLKRMRILKWEWNHENQKMVINVDWGKHLCTEPWEKWIGGLGKHIITEPQSSWRSLSHYVVLGQHPQEAHKCSAPAVKM